MHRRRMLSTDPGTRTVKSVVSGRSSWTIACIVSPAGQHLVENRAERKNIGAGINRLAQYLLGRHVACRTQHHAWSADVVQRARFGCAILSDRDSQLREAEVEDLRSTVPGDKNVLGLEVAVQNTFGVR